MCRAAGSGISGAEAIVQSHHHDAPNLVFRNTAAVGHPLTLVTLHSALLTLRITASVQNQQWGLAGDEDLIV